MSERALEILTRKSDKALTVEEAEVLLALSQSQLRAYGYTKDFRLIRSYRGPQNAGNLRELKVAAMSPRCVLWTQTIFPP